LDFLFSRKRGGMVDKASLIIVLQIITSIVIGVIGWFLKDKFKKLDEADKKNESDITTLEKAFSEFKEKMPFMYTTREDQLRAQVSLEKQIEKLGDNTNKGLKEVNDKMEKKLDDFLMNFDRKITGISEQFNKHLQREEQHNGG